ncbi:GyrI-like domain-containing protein [Chloroflexota bacterium]
MLEPVLIKSLPGQQVIALRTVAPQIEALPARLDEIASALDARAIPHKTPGGIVLYHRPPGEGSAADIGIPIDGPVSTSAVDRLTLPSGETLTVRETPYVQIAACLLHRGTYDHLADTRAALLTWIEDNGYQISGPGRMVYRNTLGDTSPAILSDEQTNQPSGQTLTELQFPVVKTKKKRKCKK